jgi:hypothetical protein
MALEVLWPTQRSERAQNITQVASFLCAMLEGAYEQAHIDSQSAPTSASLKWSCKCKMPRERDNIYFLVSKWYCAADHEVPHASCIWPPPRHEAAIYTLNQSCRAADRVHGARHDLYACVAPVAGRCTKRVLDICSFEHQACLG